MQNVTLCTPWVKELHVLQPLFLGKFRDLKWKFPIAIHQLQVTVRGNAKELGLSDHNVPWNIFRVGVFNGFHGGFGRTIQI